MGNLLSKKVLTAIVAALIAVFAALPWATGLKYACMVEGFLGGEVSEACQVEEVNVEAPEVVTE